MMLEPQPFQPWPALVSLSTMFQPSCGRCGSLFLAVRLTRHWLNQCRIFTYAQPRHVKPILYSQPFGMGIILSAASVCVPFPKLRDLTSRQHCLPAPYVRKNMVLFVFRLCSLTWFQRTLLLGSSHPPLRLSPLLPSGCKADGSRLNQHEVCLSCRGLPLSDFGLKHKQTGYTFLIAQFRPRSDG